MCGVKPVSPSRVAKVLVHHMNCDIVPVHNSVVIIWNIISVLKCEMLKKNVCALFL